MHPDFLQIPKYLSLYLDFVIKYKDCPCLPCLNLEIIPSPDGEYLEYHFSHAPLIWVGLDEILGVAFQLPVLQNKQEGWESLIKKLPNIFYSHFNRQGAQTIGLATLSKRVGEILMHLDEAQELLEHARGYCGFNPDERLHGLWKLSFLKELGLNFASLIENNAPLYLIQDYITDEMESFFRVSFSEYAEMSLIGAHLAFLTPQWIKDSLLQDKGWCHDLMQLTSQFNMRHTPREEHRVLPCRWSSHNEYSSFFNSVVLHELEAVVQISPSFFANYKGTKFLTSHMIPVSFIPISAGVVNLPLGDF